MNEEFLIGTKQEFYDFVSSIHKNEKIAVISHTDLDGISSAIFLKEILSGFGLSFSEIYFVSYSKDLFEKLELELKDKGIAVVFISDINADSFSYFEEFRKKFKVFLIDHHPFLENLVNKKNIIKTSTPDCSSLTIFRLGCDYIDDEEWAWLVCAAMFTDYSYKKKENLEFIKKYYPEVNFENISSSTPGINGRKISNALIYYKGNEKIVFDTLLKKDLDKISEVSNIVEEEINLWVGKYFDIAEFHPEKNLYLAFIDSKFDVVSPVTTIVSKYKPESAFVSIFLEKDSFKISARNQEGNIDVNNLLRKASRELDDAIAGGHSVAAGATIDKKDLSKFKENLLKT